MTGVDPHIETLDAWVSAGVRQTVPMSQLSEVFPPTYETVAKAVEAAGGTLVGPAYAEYFGMPGDTVDVEIGFGIDEVLAISGVVVKERPGTRAVVGTHVGPYDRLPEAYAELMPWLETQGVEPGESMFEWYLSEPDEEPDRTVTRLIFPIA